MKLTLPADSRPPAARVAATLVLSLGARGGPVVGGRQGGQQEGEGQGGGSRTSGIVNWWGWTPMERTANGYIAAFTKELPDLRVNVKLVSIPDWQAALTPALRSNSGPDVCDMQPGGLVGPLGIPRTVGEVFNITGEDVYTSNQIDTSKSRRAVPGFAPKLTFHRAARRMVQWRTDSPDTTASDGATDAVSDRIVDAYHSAQGVFADRAPARVEA